MLTEWISWTILSTSYYSYHEHLAILLFVQKLKEKKSPVKVYIKMNAIIFSVILLDVNIETSIFTSLYF